LTIETKVNRNVKSKAMLATVDSTRVQPEKDSSRSLAVVGEIGL